MPTTPRSDQNIAAASFRGSDASQSAAAASGASGSEATNSAAANQSNSGAEAAQLPKTASALPLLGLAGLGTFFAGFIARFRR
jgi:hypothetical protein